MPETDGTTAWYVVAVEAQAGGAWGGHPGESEGTLSNSVTHLVLCTALCIILPLNHRDAVCRPVSGSVPACREAESVWTDDIT